MRFRLVPKSMTLNDLERPKRTLSQKRCFPTYVVMIHQRHGQTDKRTDRADRRHAIARPPFALLL